MKESETSRKQAAFVAGYGMMIGLAMVLSYIEFLIPIQLAVPGVKLGLANLATMVALYLLGTQGAFNVSLIRIVLVGLTFGNMSMMLYSLAGGLVSLIVMVAGKKSGRFTQTGVSILGGVGHNIGQMAVAALVIENAAILYYLPILLIAGAVAGIFIGILGGIVIKRIGPLMKNW